MTKTIVEIYEEQQEEIKELRKRIEKLEKRMDVHAEEIKKIAVVIMGMLS